jgi:DNA-binding Lrp family transcriptional regulator
MILNGDIKNGELTGTLLKKYQHKKKILNLLYKHETLSGPVISKRIGVSLPTAISLLNELTELNYIEPRGT